MVLQDTYPVGNVWLCENDWFIRPYGSIADRLDRLPTIRVLLLLFCFVVTFPGTAFLLHLDADNDTVLPVLAIVAVILVLYQGKALWQWWTWMGGIGPLGRRNHKHRCPGCGVRWKDNEPNCPGLVEYECTRCWNRSQATGLAQASDRNSVQSQDSRHPIWHNRVGNTGITRLWRLNWGPNEPARDKLARNRFLGIGHRFWWGLAAAVAVVSIWLLFRY